MKKYIVLLFIILGLGSVFLLASDLTLTKYTVSVEVIGEEENTVSILNYTTFYGNSNQLTVNTSHDNTFCFFTERDYIISFEDQYRFRMNNDHNFKAYFKNSDKFYVAFTDANDKLISFQEVEPNASAIEPLKPESRNGYNFSRWNTDFTNITSDLIVKAIYTRDDKRYTVTSEVNGDKLKREYRMGEIAHFSAINKVGNSYFSHWEVNGKKASITSELFISVYENLTIKAIYSYAPHLDEIILYLSDHVISDQNRTTFIGRIEYSNNHNIIEYGIIVMPSSSQGVFDIFNPTVKKISVMKTNSHGEFAISIPKSLEDVKVKAYVVVRQVVNNKNTHPVYHTNTILVKGK